VCQRLKDFEDEKGWVGVEREPVQLGREKKNNKKDGSLLFASLQ